MQKSFGPGYRIAIDVGGTFVDYVLLNEQTGEIAIEKQPSTPARIVEEVSAGLGRLPVSLAEVGRILHGTTVALNTIVQEKGIKAGLITTRGFRDVLEIGRGSRPEIYNPRYTGPASLVPRYLRREVGGRMDAAGNEIEPLDTRQLGSEVDLLMRDGCEAIAICFLNSYANPVHERQAAEFIKSRHPDVALSVSSELVREWREYERTSTAVLNAYIQPPFKKYLEALSAQLVADGYSSPLAIMQSNGGVTSAATAAIRPVTTLESGPAGGVIGASALAAELQVRNVICFDVGGTTVDVALIEDNRIVERSQTKVAGRPVMGPTIDIKSVGAGGGSIAWIDDRGALRVGPQSAGASPGPACFGFGGTEATVTDCHLLLGRLDAERFLGSRMALDCAAAERAVVAVAQKLGMSLEETAVGILKLAETNMTNAIRSITIERGLDPRDYRLLSYGGGGGLFALAVSQELGVNSVIVPRVPANFSALGIVTSDYREDSSHTMVRALHADTVGEVLGEIGRLTSENAGQLRQHGFDEDAVESEVRVDIRFAGQEYTVTVPVEPEWLAGPDTFLDGGRARFVTLHRRLFGHGEPGAPIELVTVRVRSIGRVRRPKWYEARQGEPALPDSWRNTYFAALREFRRTPVFDREALVRGQAIAGPAIVEEWTTTTVILPGWEAKIDRIGNLILSNVS